MGKFIEFHHDGNQTLINIDFVSQVKMLSDESEYNTELIFGDYDSILKADETYEEVRKKIAMVQGGLPRY